MTIRKPLLALVAALAASLGIATSAAHAGGPMQTGLTNYGQFIGPTLNPEMGEVQRGGANLFRIFMGWAEVAPQGTSKPAGFDPRNPADPHYDWSSVDAQVRAARARGLEPVLSIETAPTWATQQGSGWPDGTNRPDPTEFGYFGEAIAKRYSGNFQGLPRVRYYEAWNEPNHYRHLNPQYEATPPPPGTAGDAPPPTSAFQSADVYRALLNSFSDAVHGVNPDNVVIAGSLSPTGRPFRLTPAVSPLTWMRQFLCIGDNDRQKPGCNQQANFDVWAINPYTSGDPQHHARNANDISIPDIPKMRKVLQAAVKAGQVVSTQDVQLWATEWSWDTKPPDPGAVPLKLHARWVSEAIYRMWTFGVRAAIWFQIRDDPTNGDTFPDTFQSGLFTYGGSNPANDKPKLSLEAFRFPFVAYKKGRGSVLVWGRTPFGKRGTVTIEQKNGRRFKRLKKLKANGFGIFTKRLRTSSRGDLRARLGHESSVPFSLKVPHDFPVNPFGSPTG